VSVVGAGLAVHAATIEQSKPENPVLQLQPQVKEFVASFRAQVACWHVVVDAIVVVVLIVVVDTVVVVDELKKIIIKKK
jgi:hypothetical protein